MDEFDFSDLINEVPVPPNGAARARKTAITRRHRRQAAATTLAVFAVLAIGVSVISTRHDSVLINPATHVTLAEEITTTTSTTIDPRSLYVGNVHKDSGSGLPGGASIISSNLNSENVAAGNSVLYWVNDAKGDMVWLDTALAVDVTTGEVTSRTQAVLALPALTGNQSVCLGTCTNAKTGKQLPNTVGVIEGRVVRSAWAVDTKATTFTEASVKGLAGSAPTTTTTEVSYPDPPRPELYGVIAKCKPDECPWYTQHEQTTANGGGGSAADQYTIMMTDNKAKKYADVWLNGVTVYDTLVVDQSMGQPLPAGNRDYTYQGKTGISLLLIMNGDTIKAAWKMDTTTHKIVAINPSDVAKVSPKVA